MRLLSTVILVSLMGLSTPAKANGLCQLFFHFLGKKVEVRDHSPESYAKSKKAWERKLKGVLDADRGDVIFKQLQTENGSHPNHLMALMDALNPTQAGRFSELVREINELGYSIQFRNSRFENLPYFTRSKGFHWIERKVAGKKTNRYGFPFFWRVSGRTLTIRFPQSPPKSPEEVVQRVAYLSNILASQKLALVAQHAPLRSHPLTNGEYSFPKDSLTAMHRAETHIYTILKNLETVFPSVGENLHKRDGVWKWKNTQLILNALVTPFYPWYRPDKRMSPNRETYTRFLQDIESATTGAPLEQATFPKTQEWARKKYERRFQLKWFSDRYVTALKGLFVASLGWTAFRMAWGLFDNEFEVIPVPVPVGGGGNLDELDQETLRNLLTYYEDSLEHLRRTRDANGDPQGVIQREIEALADEIARLKKRLQ